MIRNHNDIVIKIYYNGNEINKVFQKQIQVYPDQKFQDIFWLKVNDISDYKTYYYLCKKTKVVYNEIVSTKISEITYETTTKQENEPAGNYQIFELLNDDVGITGQAYEVNDFASFEDKSPNDVLSMTQTYQEKLITGKILNQNIKPIEGDKQLYLEYEAKNYKTIVAKHTFNENDFDADVSDMKYVCDWYKPGINTNTTQGYFSITNNSEKKQTIKYIAYSEWSLAQVFITTDIDDIKLAQKTIYNNVYDIKTYKGILVCYGGYSDWGNNRNDFQKKMLSVSIDPKQTLYFFACWYLHYDDTAEPDMDYMPYWYRYVCLMAFYNKDISIISNGNILKHKYISDDILEKQIKKIKYNYAYAMVKNDLSNVVYQTNCKYILSKEIFEKIEVNYALIIPTKSIGWKLLSREEWVKYMPYNTNYKMSLTVANFDYTGEEFFGLLDKSSDTADFRTFGYGSSYIYVDPGNDRWQINRKKSLKTNITFVFDGTNRQYNAFENGSGYGPWTDSNSSSLSFTDNKTTLYLNAYESESNLTNESFTFYEFKIEDKDGNLVKRIVPSDEPKRLYETVSMTYIEPCRTVQDSSLPTLIDNIKLGVDPVDGLGNKIKNWYI